MRNIEVHRCDAIVIGSRKRPIFHCCYTAVSQKLNTGKFGDNCSRHREDHEILLVGAC